MSPEVRPSTQEGKASVAPVGESRTIFEIQQQQAKDAADLAELLKELGTAPEQNNMEPLTRRQWEKAVGKDLSFLGRGMNRTVYGVSSFLEGDQDPSSDLPADKRLVLKADKTWVAPEDQEEEKDLNGVLSSLFPDHFPKIHANLQVEVDGKKGSGTYTERVYFAPQGTEVKAPFAIVEKILKEEIGLPRFLDSNIGNGVKDERTGTKEESIVDRGTGAEVYVDDTGILIPADILKARKNILAFVARNTGVDAETRKLKRYTPEEADWIKANLAAFTTKYSGEVLAA